MERVFTRQFKFKGVEYELNAVPGGPVEFHVTEGATSRAAYETHFFFRNDGVSTSDIPFFNCSPIGVFRQVGKLLEEWLFTESPWGFNFSPSTDRKYKIYKRLAQTLLKRIESVYGMYEYGHTFWFYKKG